MVLIFLTVDFFGSRAGAALLNLLGIVVIFGLWVGVTIPGAGAELLAGVVSGA